MLSKKITCAAQVLALTLAFTGCGKKASDEIDFGTLNNTVYQNQYFGFSVKLPKDWSVQDQQAQQRIMKKGAQMVAGDNGNLKAMVKASELQSVNLFAAFEHPVGSPVEYNPSIMSVAEVVRELPGIKRGKDYLFQAKKVLQTGQIQVSFPKEFYPERLGGVEFDVMESEISMLGKVIRQKYYTTIRKGYALCFIVSFTNDDEAASLRKILDSVEFN
jgi:hypothetical protein